MLQGPRYPLIVLFFFLATLGIAGCGATPMDNVDASLLGTWQGKANVRPPISFVPPSDDTPRQPEVTVPLKVTIHADARVTGSVGDAELVDCVLKYNRGELGRQLNLASDFIIMDGHLQGSIIPGDEELHKDFTIPFNVVDGHIQGSIMWLQKGKYPSPLMRVDLTRNQGLRHLRGPLESKWVHERLILNL